MDFVSSLYLYWFPRSRPNPRKVSKNSLFRGTGGFARAHVHGATHLLSHFLCQSFPTTPVSVPYRSDHRLPIYSSGNEPGFVHFRTCRHIAVSMLFLWVYFSVYIACLALGMGRTGPKLCTARHPVAIRVVCKFQPAGLRRLACGTDESQTAHSRTDRKTDHPSVNSCLTSRARLLRFARDG